MKIGDKVQFLSEKGGGIIAAFQGKNIALVEDEDGFQIPTPITDLVVMGSGADYNTSKAQRPQQPDIDSGDATPEYFNMSVKAKMNAYDDNINEEEDTDPSDFDITYKAPIVERKGGNQLGMFLAFVPTDIKNFSKTKFECYLINDSNYYIQYLYLAVGGATCQLLSNGELQPNTKVGISTLSYEDVANLDKVRLQFMAYKLDKEFVAKPVGDVQFRIDNVKFCKLHAFQTNDFFESPALLYPIVVDDKLQQQASIDASRLIADSQTSTNSQATTPSTTIAYEKLKGLATTTGKRSKPSIADPLVVDLHATEILDTTLNMSAVDILNYQLDYFRRTLEEHRHQKGLRIVFIHGKGEGVLRHAIVNELRHKYKAYTYQDASFQEYGYGATQVTIR